MCHHRKQAWVLQQQIAFRWTLKYCENLLPNKLSHSRKSLFFLKAGGLLKLFFQNKAAQKANQLLFLLRASCMCRECIILYKGAKNISHYPCHIRTNLNLCIRVSKVSFFLISDGFILMYNSAMVSLQSCHWKRWHRSLSITVHFQVYWKKAWGWISACPTPGYF